MTDPIIILAFRPWHTSQMPLSTIPTRAIHLLPSSHWLSEPSCHVQTVRLANNILISSTDQLPSPSVQFKAQIIDSSSKLATMNLKLELVRAADI